MADGPFKHHLNYIDHCTKFMISVPLTSKQASAVAQALVSIFTEIGPPVIIQTDNGGEFSGIADDRSLGICLVLEDNVRSYY